MNISDLLIGLIAPYDCVGCQQEGALLCGRCVLSLTTLPARCFNCRKISQENTTCSTCRRGSKLHRVAIVTTYETQAKALIWELKFAGARAAARVMAECMISKLGLFSSEAILVAVPTASHRARQRGYDQAQLLAKELARKTGFHYVKCLARSGKAHQHGQSRRVRRQQMSTIFRVTNIDRIRGAHIVLVDDVVTTGATLEAAAATLKAVGARKVEAIVFAQP